MTIERYTLPDGSTAIIARRMTNSRSSGFVVSPKGEITAYLTKFSKEQFKALDFAATIHGGESNMAQLTQASQEITIDDETWTSQPIQTQARPLQGIRETSPALALLEPELLRAVEMHLAGKDPSRTFRNRVLRSFTGGGKQVGG